MQAFTRMGYDRTSTPQVIIKLTVQPDYDTALERIPQKHLELSESPTHSATESLK